MRSRPASSTLVASHARTAPPAIPLWAAVCFTLSGAAGLLYEVVWSKQLTYLLGGSLQAVATVVAAFLGGLALGAHVLGGRWASGSQLSLRYARIELAVAALGVAVLPILRASDPVVGALYRACGGEGPAFALARVVLLTLVLVPPAALMGATLPVLVARFERGRLGASLAGLYALNTLGAVAGSLAGGFVLLPVLGLLSSTFVAAALNVSAALVAWRWGGGETQAAPAARTSPQAILSDPRHTAFSVLVGVSGFAALAMQLAWVRLYGLVLGSSVYSFSAVLGVYLLGLALGSALIARALERVAQPAAYAVLQALLACTALAGPHVFPSLPRAMLELGERSGTSWPALMRGELLMVLPWVGLPCVCLGAAFPLAARLLQRGDGGAAAGSAYAINTLGTIAGSLATGFFLLPALGVNGVLALAAALCAAVALGSLGVAPPRTAPAAATLTLLAGAAVLAWSTPAWDPVLMSLGTYRPNSAIHLRQGFDAAGATGDPAVVMAAAQKTLFYREGINASVLVASDLQGRGRWMRVGGKIDASTGDMLTQVMLGVLPAAMADSGARTLIVGHGSGFTAAAALAAGAGKTDIAELEPAVVEGSRLFHTAGSDPLDDPRVTLHLEDARTRLAHGGGAYQLIISEPTNPWIAGVNNLFTVDFYRLVRKRLASDGVFCQWIQMYELSPETFRSMLASFLNVFPDVHLFCLWRQSDVLVIAAPPGRALSYARLHSSAVLAQLRPARMSSPDEIADFYLGSGAAVRAFVQGAALDTDDLPFVEYQAPRDLIAIGRGTSDLGDRLAAAFGRPLQPAAGGPLDAWPAGAVLTARARSQILTADADGAMRIFAQLRAMGAGDIADAVDRGFRAQAAAQAAATPKQ